MILLKAWLNMVYFAEIDECDSSPCQNGAACDEDGVAAFSCNCLAGYTDVICSTGR